MWTYVQSERSKGRVSLKISEQQAGMCSMFLPFTTSSPVRMISEDPWRAMWNAPHTRMLFDANVCSVDRSQKSVGLAYTLLK